MSGNFFNFCDHFVYINQDIEKYGFCCVITSMLNFMEMLQFVQKLDILGFPRGENLGGEFLVGKLEKWWVFKGRGKTTKMGSGLLEVPPSEHEPQRSLSGTSQTPPARPFVQTTQNKTNSCGAKNRQF